MSERSLPHAPSEECIRCGGDVEPDRRELTLVDSAESSGAFTTGNLCPGCFQRVQRVLQSDD